MKKVKIPMWSIFLICILQAIVGCSSKSTVRTLPVDDASIMQGSANHASEVEERISRFASLIHRGKCGLAQQSVRYLLDNYVSADRTFEVALLTDLCLCHLEQEGDIHRFMACAGNLEKMSRQDNGYLPKDTQFVLEMYRRLEPQFDSSQDMRVDRSIKQVFDDLPLLK